MDKPARHGFIGSISRFFSDFARAVVHGDFFVKLTLVFMGAGYVRRRQYIKAILITLLQAAAIYAFFNFSLQYLVKFGTLGTVAAEQYFDPVTFTNIWNDYDHSFKILLYSVVSIVAVVAFILLWIQNVKIAYSLQLEEEQGNHIGTFIEDIRRFSDEKFHITLLSLPVAGVCLFTIVPLIVMIAIAFTNYDQQHMPPSGLFSWVGLANFKTLFTNSLTSSFGYAFGKILSWTLVWAVLATATCYVGGIMLAMLINNKRTRGKKIWRASFIVAMAVPQFVSLLLVRNFFADSGIVNTFCSSIGLTELLKNIGLVPSYMTYIPFLTHPGWAKFMIIMINIWIGVPYLLLMATGILMNIPQEQYESARIDGANSWQQFRHITMPYMLFVTAPYLINSVVQNINNFNVIYLLTQDVYTTSDQLMANSNAKEIDLLVTWLFRLTNEYYNYKMAAVIGIAVFIVCAIITLIAFNYVTRDGREESYQ